MAGRQPVMCYSCYYLYLYSKPYFSPVFTPRIVHIMKWTVKYISVEGDEMTDKFVNAMRKNFSPSLCCTLTHLLNRKPVLAGIYLLNSTDVLIWSFIWIINGMSFFSSEQTRCVYLSLPFPVSSLIIVLSRKLANNMPTNLDTKS